MPTFAFSGGSLEVKDYGQRNKMRFGGVWVAGDSWTARMTSTLSGNFTLGKGNIAGKTITSLFKFRNRAILGFSGGFALSAIDDPSGWEEQDIGSAVIPFSTQFGSGDTAYGFSSIGARCVIFGGKTTQTWNIDADPSKWSLAQVLDNTGTKHGLGIQAIGEVDVLYPDATGIRSLKSKELSGDAYVSDVGTPIDSVIKTKIFLAELNSYPICSVVDPITKNYWVYIYDTLYCLSQHPGSKITAWSSFTVDYVEAANILTGTTTITGLTAGVRYHWEKGTSATNLINGTETVLKEGSFVAQGTSVTITDGVGTSSLYPPTTLRPTRMWAVDGFIYFIDTNKKLYRYSQTLADSCYTVAETPWLDLGSPSQVKVFEGVDIAAIGSWRVSVATNPQTNNFTHVMQRTPVAVPTIAHSSTYDSPRFAPIGVGTHIKLRFECSDRKAIGTQSKLSSVNILYKNANQK